MYVLKLMGVETVKAVKASRSFQTAVSVAHNTFYMSLSLFFADMNEFW